MLRKLFACGWRLAAYQAFNYFYDYACYPAAQYYFGLIQGSGLAALGSLISCAFLFWRYDRSKIDWLGAKYISDLAENGDSKNRLDKILVWMKKKRSGKWGRLLNPLIFILATNSFDPLIVAVHFRESLFEGISWRDWKILLKSVVLANLIWMVRVGLTVEILKWLKDAVL